MELLQGKTALLAVSLNQKGNAMRKTLVALAAVATLAVSAMSAPAHAQRGLGAAVAGGIIGGAIVGGAIAASPYPYGYGPGYYGPATDITAARPMSRLTLMAVTGSGSVSGTAITGGFAACGFAADPRSSSLKQTRLSP